ncbi:SHOCT domain-containing protein [Caldimonas aquatica]|uniref:SHOCT domain-containing protein n=1 Tax=Caldimonas aquatica TaxID=376175 RepID=A0ABY6MWC6_9BURK|nr:SHOCT domain-containing protein [Schlegelella aquatica]UZD56315.1 SHOCT domain-containing protein [Schlegelella aquatica]
MKQPKRAMLALALAVGATAALPPAHAGIREVLFGRGEAGGAGAGPGEATPRRVWSVREFTQVRLVPREPQAQANQHPAAYTPEQLRRWMETITFLRNGRQEPLFGADELAELPVALAQALAFAAPGDDVVLLSTSRRDAGLLATPLGITARLFVQPAGALNLVVHDARLDFVNAYRGSRLLPEFDFGSRERPGSVTLASSAAELRRQDWLVFRGAEGAATAAAGGVARAGASVPAAPAAPAGVNAGAPGGGPTAAGRAAASGRAVAPRDAHFYEEQEQRLQALKRLRERDLISEEEYRAKRKEILDAL